jgi:hypothetical protein
VEVIMLKRHFLAGLALGIAAFAAPSWAEGDVDVAALAKALPAASVTLEQGMKAGEAQGTPISAKFEIENGALQLSIYTMNRDQFSEVIVDHKKGSIDKSEAITSGDDLKAAAEQGAAMSKAKLSLGSAVQAAVGANAGYRAVSAEPSLDGGHPVATVVLLKGQDMKKVTQKLD